MHNNSNGFLPVDDKNINKIVEVIIAANKIIENAIIFEDEQGYGGLTPTYLVEKSLIDKFALTWRISNG